MPDVVQERAFSVVLLGPATCCLLPDGRFLLLSFCQQAKSLDNLWGSKWFVADVAGYVLLTSFHCWCRFSSVNFSSGLLLIEKSALLFLAEHHLCDLAYTEKYKLQPLNWWQFTAEMYTVGLVLVYVSNGSEVTRVSCSSYSPHF